MSDRTDGYEKVGHSYMAGGYVVAADVYHVTGPGDLVIYVWRVVRDSGTFWHVGVAPYGESMGAFGLLDAAVAAVIEWCGNQNAALTLEREARGLRSAPVVGIRFKADRVNPG